MILLDTDVCIELLRGNTKVLSHMQKNSGNIAVSFITVGELYYGAFNSSDSKFNVQLITAFLENLIVIQSDNGIMEKFGWLKAKLRNKGLMLPDADIIVASTCSQKCSRLITGNIKHYNRFESIKLENWIE
ncbi:MAG: PIN domain-containing protein [Victivallales bacterium]|jgi:tRNA(fMet)-specific endonuclease VapC